jgi:hypothetical protein
MNAALQSGDADVIGLGRPLCVEPDLPAKLLSANVEMAWLTPERERKMQLSSVTVTDWNDLPSMERSSYYLIQLVNLGRTGSSNMNLTFDEAREAFVQHEKDSFAELKNFGA